MKKFYRFVACLLSVVLCVSLAPRGVVVLVSADSETAQEFTGYTVRSAEEYEAVKEELGSIAPLTRECDRYSMLSDAEKDKILTLYGITVPEMEELEELGFSISTSAQYARVMNTYDLSMEEVVYAADMFGDVNLLAVELRRFGEFIADKELSQEMIDHVRAMVLEGHEYVKAMYSYAAAQVMQMDAETASASSSGMQAAPVRRSLLSEQEESLLSEEMLWFESEDLQDSESVVDEHIVALSEFYGIDPEVLQEYLDETAIDIEEFEELLKDAMLELCPSDEETGESTSLTQNQLSSASMTASVSYSAMSGTGEEEDVISAPFTYQKTEYESVNLNTGDYMYEETDLVLPGKNGLDLVLTRRYDSSDANIEIPWGFVSNPNAIVYTLRYVYYLQSAGTNDLECYESNRISPNQYNRYTWGDGVAHDVLLHESAMVSYAGQYDYYMDLSDGRWYFWDTFSMRNMNIQFRIKDKDYMMQCIEQYIEPAVFTSTDTVTGELIGILAQPEIIVNENTLSTAAYSGTSTLANAYSQNRYGLGIGWSYAFTSIDKYFDTTYDTDLIENETHFMLNLADGRKFRVNFENGDTGEIEGYLGENIILTTQNQGGANQTYTVRYADGKTETMNKDGFITQIKDRYNNSINFIYEYTSSEYDSLSRAKKMTITDTLGRVVTLDDFQNNSSKRILTAPDGTTKEFTLATDNSNGRTYKYLTEVKDENDRATEYRSIIREEEFNVFSPRPLEEDGLIGKIGRRYLTTVFYTTNVEEEEDGRWSLQFTQWGSSLRHISNGIGHQGYRRLKTRYIFRNKVGEKRTNMTEYSYESDPTAYGHTYLWINGNATKYSTTAKDYYYWWCVPEGETRQGSFMVYYGKTRYEFDTSNRMRRERVYTALTDEAPYIHVDLSNNSIINPDTRIQERDYTYGWTEKPISIVERTYNYAGGGDYVEKSHLYEYDWTGNVTKYTDPVGHVTDYTYDISTGNYNMPLTKTYKRDANTTIKEQYTLTADKKDIKIHEAYENNVRKQKTEYTYDT
ncbi:MAG: DUF6531 domain-containing protein, partial [Oscillospiraceae bacterium]|nr:DUF6531 domain-containing protein [Oscillospiraceae bacterium]